MAFGRKRTYGGFGRRRSRRPVKRSRFSRSRVRRSLTFSGRTPAGRSSLFVGRKLTRKQWRSSLYRHTRHLQHWRSLRAQTSAWNTPAAASQVTTNMFEAIDGSFWEDTGGWVPADTGATTTPVFNGDITIRGGVIGMAMNNTNDESVYVSVYLIKMNPRGSTSWTANTDAVWGWEPSLFADFMELHGKIVYSTQKILLPGGSFKLIRKIPTMKIDQATHNATGTYRWLTVVGNLSATAVTVTGTFYHNLSFTGDSTVDS